MIFSNHSLGESSAWPASSTSAPAGSPADLPVDQFSGRCQKAAALFVRENTYHEVLNTNPPRAGAGRPGHRAGRAALAARGRPSSCPPPPRPSNQACSGLPVAGLQKASGIEHQVIGPGGTGRRWTWRGGDADIAVRARPGVRRIRGHWIRGQALPGHVQRFHPGRSARDSRRQEATTSSPRWANWPGLTPTSSRAATRRRMRPNCGSGSRPARTAGQRLRMRL